MTRVVGCVNILQIATTIVVLLRLIALPVVAFILQHNKSVKLHYVRRLRPLQLSSPSPDADDNIAVIGVVAPLRYVGPYACLGLHFPRLEERTQQRNQQQNGVSINFVLDTGCKHNQ